MAKIKTEREELDLILQNQISNTPDLPSSDQAVQDVPHENLFEFNPKSLLKKAQSKARKLIKQTISHVFDEDMVINNPVVKGKMQTDVITLGSILYQLELNQFMQEQMGLEIQRGAASARMFETFSSSSKTIAEINKQVITTIEALKSTYKLIRSEIDNEDMGSSSQPSSDATKMLRGGLDDRTCYGTRDIITGLRNRPPNVPIKDAIDVEFTEITKR